MDPAERLHSPAAARNVGPLLQLLRTLVRPGHTVLEVASGSGQHAAAFTAALPGVVWQPSDADPRACASIATFVAAAPGGALRPPWQLDVTADPWPAIAADALVCVNLLHIAPAASALGLVRGAAACLTPRGTLLVYGPFADDGAMAPSNAAFDRSLRAEDPRWGVRDVAWLTRLAADAGLRRRDAVPMPANNQALVFERAAPPRRTGAGTGTGTAAP